MRRRAPAELVEQQQRARTEVPQRLGRLGQLVLEGGAAAAQLVSGAHAREERAHGRERARVGGHVRAQLRQQHDEPHLSRVAALAAHVRTHQHECASLAAFTPVAVAAAAAAAAATQRGVVGHKWGAAAGEAGGDEWVAAPTDVDGGGVLVGQQRGRAVAWGGRECGERLQTVEARHPAHDAA